MRDFDEIVAIAAERTGGMAALEESLADSKPLDPAVVAAIPDDRILSAMTRRVFQAGFSWKVIDAKWDGFEEALHGFDPGYCASMPEDAFDALLKNGRIVRNAAKIRSVSANAQFVLELAQSHGSAARMFAFWPDADYVGLLEVLKKRANRLSGQAGMRFLRSIGRPAFITTGSVVAALIRDGVITKEPSSKRDMDVVQAAFNVWSAASGRDLTTISRILAMSVES